ncbi:MAG: DegT/DnrJ/EryC1/StrS family aminotransferase [Negativicutes bacterium]|jgi:dTDP-4-amino-4,6-dideoxygalactose transaminase
MEVSNTSFAFFNEKVAFYCLLQAFGIGRHDKVLLPAYTSSFVPQTVSYTAASPEFVEFDPSSYNSLLKHYVQAYENISAKKEKGKLAALLIHHTYGSPNPETEKIVNWAKEKGLLVFEYCEYAPQLDSNGRALGTYGDGAFFSFGSQGIAHVTNPKYLGIMAAMESVAPKPTKPEALGIIIRYSLRYLLNKYRSFRLAVSYLARVSPLFGSEFLSHEPSQREFFKGVCTIQHRLSKYYAKQFDTVIAHRKQLALYYGELLRKRGLTVYEYSEGAILSNYPVKVTNRQACLEAAAAAGLEFGQGLNYPLFQSGEEYYDWDNDLESSALSGGVEVVCLPLHSQVTRAYAEELVGFLECFIKGIDYQPVGRFENIRSKIASMPFTFEHIGDKASQFLRRISWLSYKS